MTRTRGDDKRQRILDAAVRVFAKKGFFASRVSDVAAAAGIADGTVYLYFESKDDILIRLFEGVMSLHITEAKRELGAAPDARARLRIIADHHLGLLGDNPELAVVFQVELRQSTKFMELFTASWLKDYFDLVEEAIAIGQRNGAIRGDLPRKLAAHTFFGGLDALVTSWVLSRNAFDLRALAAPAVELFLGGAAAASAGAARSPVRARVTPRLARAARRRR